MQAYIDCRAGISGDMTLAALCDVGLDLAPLEAMLRSAGIDCTVRHWRETRAGGPGCRVEVEWNTPQPLRHPADMAAIIAKMPLTDSVRSRALAALHALTEAEAHAHQIAPEDVHFHEVGGVDTLADIVGTAWGLARLGISRVHASALPWFTGTVQCDHGLLPLPAPATAYLMRGKPVFATDATTELVTPTGAAILHALVDSHSHGPCGTLHSMGTGFGSRPSVSGLRLWLIEEYSNISTLETVALLESHIDHLSGEALGAAIEALSALPEVLDVLWLPGITKKNRPGGALRILCLPPHADIVLAALFRHTHTLGIRRQYIERAVLPRSAGTIATAHGTMPAKIYTVDGHDYARPEADAAKGTAGWGGLGQIVTPGCHHTPA